MGLGLSQAELGALAGTSADAVGRCERGYLDRDEEARAVHLLSVMGCYHRRDWGAEMLAWRHRARVGMTEAARRAGLNYRTWATWEKGQGAYRPSPRVAAKIAALLASDPAPAV